MKLPILLSVPHAGLAVPFRAKPYCRLTLEQIIKDGDEGAAEIYDFRRQVTAFVSTGIARAIVDVNRARDNRRGDGVVKTSTCWNELVYNRFPPDEVIKELLERYYDPYHKELRKKYTDEVQFAIDCHTMAAVGPPIGPDTGMRRPTVCLGDANGSTMPPGWTDDLADCFREAFDGDVTINQPFSGGYITRTHGQRRPWVQLELTRDPVFSNREKRTRVLTALTAFCDQRVVPR